MNIFLDLIGRPFSWIPDAILAAKSQAVSKNLQELSVRDHSSLLSKIVNSASANVNQTNIIKFSNIAGDLVISGNRVVQNASVDLRALYNISNDQSVQRDIAAAVQQSAKSLTTGINFLQSSAAINESRQYVDVASTVSSEIANSCLASTVQYSNFEVDKVGGSFTFNNNSFAQMSSSLASCTNTVVSRESSLSKLAFQVAQTSQATLEGFSLAQLIGLYVVIVVAAGGAALFMLNKTSGRTLNFVQNNLPLIVCVVLAVVGVVTASAGWAQSTPTILTDAFSTLYNCPGGILKSVAGEPSIAAVGQTCLDNSACVGFDARATSTGYDATYYAQLCPTKITIDKSTTVVVPEFQQGPGAPTLSSPGNMWLDTATSDLYAKNSGAWALSGRLSRDAFGLDSLPAVLDTGADVATHLQFDTKTYECRYKALVKVVKAPRFLTVVPQFVNTSGYKVINWRKIQMSIGVILAIVGIIAALYILLVKKSKPVKLD